MSMQSVLGVAGGIIGSFFGYPQIGFMVGSLVGGLLTPKEKTEGPRLDDLKVQVSTYGAGIPLLYGTERIGGNVIWSTDRIEFKTTEEAGKGGGAEHSTYSYFVHMRIALCETPRDGSEVSIVQIFRDGKLIWDARSGIPIGSALASEENLFAFFALYQGHSDQLPDAIEEIYSGGAGSVPAYRGIVSISMRAIDCPGGRIPQFSFVLSTSTTIDSELDELIRFDEELDGFAVHTGQVMPDGTVWNLSVDAPGGGVVEVLGSSASNGVSQASWTGNFASSTMSSFPTAATGAVDPTGVYVATSGGKLKVNAISMKDGTVAQILESENSSFPGAPDAGYSYLRGAFDRLSNRYALVCTPNSIDHTPILVVTEGFYIACDNVAANLGAIAFYDGVVYGVTLSGGSLSIIRRNADDGSSLTDIAGPSFPGSLLRRSSLYVDDKGIFAAVCAIGGAITIYKIGDAGWTVLAADLVLGESLEVVPRGFYANDRVAMLGPFFDGGIYYAIRFNAVSTAEVEVKEIIVDQCERAGESRYDVTGLPDAETIHGYKIQNPASARANIDPLLTAFGIYIVDEDGMVKFKKYEDITPVATISYDELGQAEDGAEPGDAMPLSRTQEIDLPRSVTVSYVEQTFDYQTASEKESRQVTEATEDLTIELPIATNSDHAKRVASMILFARWRAQNTRSLKVSRKYAFVSPGDGVTVEYPRGTWRLWRVMSGTDTGALCEWNIEPGDAELFTQTAIGATGYVRQEVSPLPPPTNLALLDIPILRDEDNNAGLYAAAEGYGTGWRGYTLWSGVDDSSLQERGTATSSVALGFSESALGTWSPNMLDGQNSVVINMGDDTLSSTTEDVLMTSRTNLAFIGVDGRWEAIQFMTASSLGDGRYLIYGLLRGLYGTERFRGTHQTGDKFVLISQNGMLRPGMSSGSIGQEMRYRAISLGRSLSSTSSVSFTNHAIGLLPYSPWDARKSKAASNDQTLTWQRRSRLGTNSLRGIVPIGEAAEAYTIGFYTSSAFTTLAGTLTSSTRSLTITSAQQTAFGLTPGATLFVRISQVSDVVGAGPALEATL
jgi:hypothetical protein